jgi:hydroxymethylbilane synthase
VTRLVVATRASRLALAQTQWVIDSLKAVHPGLEVAIHTVTTQGDQDARTELWKFTTSGLFTSQVEHAILEGKADFAVHSFKDLPTELTGGLWIAAIPRRHPPEDVLVCSRAVSGVEGLWPGAKVGTSSPRRIALLRNQRSDLEIVTVRGNVETRVRKVTSCQVDAVVMARAGLDRIGLSDRIACILDPVLFIPAPAQGALAIQCRGDAPAVVGILKVLDDPATRLVVEAERAVLSRLHPGCHAPVGVYANRAGDDIILSAFVAEMSARRVLRRQVRGPAAQSLELANRLADELIGEGAVEILSLLENHE